MLKFPSSGGYFLHLQLYVCLIPFSSKNPEEAELEDILNSVVRFVHFHSSSLIKAILYCAFPQTQMRNV